MDQVIMCAVGDARHPATDNEGRATGHQLCTGHFERMARMLREIQTEAADLDIVPSIAISLDTGGGGHSATPAFEQAPARINQLVLTDTRLGRGDSEDAVEKHAGRGIEPVIVVLTEYANRVRAERVLGYPVESYVDCMGRQPGSPRHGPAYGLPCRDANCRAITWQRTIPIPATVDSERRVLTRHLEWVANWSPTEEYPFGVRDVFTRLRRLLAALHSANDTAQHPIGRCPVDDDEKGTTCRGPLWPVKPKETSGEEWTGSSPSAVQCNTCGAKWEGPAELARLALILEDQRKAKAA